MIRGGPFSFDYEWEPDQDTTIMLSVEGVVTDYHPAVMYCRNGDPGWPAEGGDVEDMRVYFPDGSEMKSISKALDADLIDHWERNVQ